VGFSAGYLFSRHLQVATSGVDFINILRAAFEHISLCQKITKPNCNYRKAAQSTFVQKICAKNVAEIDTRGQFHLQVYEQLLHTDIPNA